MKITHPTPHRGVIYYIRLLSLPSCKAAGPSKSPLCFTQTPTGLPEWLMQSPRLRGAKLQEKDVRSLKTAPGTEREELDNSRARKEW